MKERDYILVIDGKFNRKAIMQRAWCIVKNDKRVGLRTSFATALRQAWNDAHVKMDLHLIEKRQDEERIEPKQVNIVREFLYRPEYRYYDSTWR